MKEKIYASLEEFDSILNFNRPNGSSKSWYLDELKFVNPPLMWGNWNIFRENGEMFDNFKDTVIPHSLSDVVEFVEMNNIKELNHLYIISVYDPSFFKKNEKIGFRCISEKYKDDIRNGKSKIVILYTYEGFSGMIGNDDFEIIERWRIDEDFPSKSVYCITGNLICDQIVKNKNLDLEAFGLSVFDRLNSNYLSNDVLTFEPDSDKNLFLSYNRIPKYHRVLLIYNMIKFGVFDKGLISLGKLQDWLITKLSNSKNFEKEILNKIITNTPFTIQEDLTYNLACNISIDDYKRTFISIVTETISSNDTLFLSEKIFKPIIVGHPFIVYGNPNTLKYLKEIGYKTFDKWIDESYDCEFDEEKRSRLIVLEIYKLQKLTKIGRAHV